MKQLLIIISFLSLPIYGFAQFSIQGIINDETGESLYGATVVLIDQDSTMISFGLTNSEGMYRLDNIKKDNYILQVTYIGYANYSQKITVDWSKEKITLNPIALSVSSEILQEVTIKAEHIPMGISGDTISYNANAFKTKPNATVEDLLKQLPGIEVARDGSIKAQGEEVKKVMVDGKEFFGGNAAIATKNIDAKAVNKVQVFDKKSEEAEFSGVDDGKDEKTINLELKEEYKVGGFGNALVSGGTEQSYNTKVNYFRFSPKLQASIIFSANNVNEQTFSWSDKTEFLGGFANAMNSSIDVNYRRGNVEGITEALTSGLNLSYDLTPKITFTSFYFYNQSNKDLQKTLKSVNFADDFSFINEDTISSRNENEGHKGHVKILYKLSPQTKMTLKSDLNFGNSFSNRNTRSSLIKDQIDNGYSYVGNANRNHNWRSNTNLFVSQNFKKKGRGVNGNITYSNSKSDGSRYIDNVNRIIGNYFDLNQYQDNDNINEKYNFNFKYTEPLPKKMFLSLRYNTDIEMEKLESEYYDIIGNVQERNGLLSNVYDKRITKNKVGLSLKKTTKKITVSAGLAGQFINLKGDISNPFLSIDNVYKHIIPSFSFKYEFKKRNSLRAGLYSNVTTPNLNQLQPVVNNTNPNIIYMGNPNLKPSQKYRPSINYSYWDQFSFTSLWTRIYSEIAVDRIINQVTIDENLVQTRTPINSKRYFSLGSSVSYSRPIKPLKIKFNIDIFYKYANYDSYINTLESTVVEGNKSIRLKVENRNRDKVSIAIGVKYSYNTRDFMVSEDFNQVYDDINYFLDVEGYLPKGWTLASSYTFYQFNNSTFDDNPSYHQWNVSMSKMFLDDKLEIRLDANDLLNQNLGYDRVADVNSYQESYYNYLGRYFMLGVNYKLGKKKKD